jgi:predicted DNA-binding transcriptional regulator YafY
MRRADRLFQIVNVLRQRRTSTTAAHLAQRTGVSERTIYRDIRDLILAGTPIDGEAGVGYRIRPGASLPPLMFDRDEIQALVLDAILNKVSAVVPKDLAAHLSETRLFVPRSFGTARSGGTLNSAREALTARRKLQLDYAAPGGQLTERTVRPLGLFFWGQQWTLAAWCELREDFRNFRLDRVGNSTLLDEVFVDEPGKTLRDMLTRYGPEAARLIDG